MTGPRASRSAADDVGTLTVNAFRTNADGTLTKIAAYGGLPSTFAGMAAS